MKAGGAAPSSNLFLRRGALLRHSARDTILILLALAHGALLAAFPPAPIVAAGLWWESNTVSHNFIHRPFFVSRLLNRLFSLWLSLVLGFPQTFWRERHLAHHAGRRPRWRLTGPLLLETLALGGLWTALALLAPGFLLGAYLPGWLAGLCLCALQGHGEHAGGTTSHHGRLYNLLFFNDGYHVEHHARPDLHWSALPAAASDVDRTSRLPPILRSPAVLVLDFLERVVLSARPLQRLVLERHERAFRTLLPRIGPVERAAIVGGGLFPRTALILTRLLPGARLDVIEASTVNVERARPLVDAGVRFIGAPWDPRIHRGYDLVVFPLAFRGDRSAIYAEAPARTVLVHDWIWRRRGTAGAVVSVLLLKRLNLVGR